MTRRTILKRLHLTLQTAQIFFIVAILMTDLPVYAAKNTTLETITVTANKRKDTAYEISSSISVQDEFFIEDHGIKTTEEMTRFVPNLYYKTNVSGDAFISRGISTIDTSLFSPMGFYVDDVPQTLSFMQNFSLFDVKRVEVLRGPQSTLYGKNSSSGVINVVLSRPDNETRAKISATAGDKYSWNVGAMASGPLVTERFYFGLSVLKDKTDGYLENILTGDDTAGEQDNLSARGTIRWTPTEKIDMSLVLNKTDRDMGIGHLRYETGPYATDAYKIYSNIPDRADQDRLGQSLRWKYQFEWADFLSITSHQDFTRSHRMDLDRSPLLFGHSAIEIEQDSWTEEFRLSSKGEECLSWVTGFYYNREELDTDFALRHVNPDIARQNISQSTIEGTAIFGQVTLPLNRHELAIGLRLDHYSGDGSQIYTSQTGTRSYQADISETKLLPMASLTHSFTNRNKAYLLFSTGWLGGGYDYYTGTSKKSFVYDPEYTKNYEVGVKTVFWNNRVHANLAFFYTDIEDKQVKKWSPQGGLGAWTLTNAAQAHTTGVELEVRANPWANLECFTSLGYAKAEFDEWVSTSHQRGTVDYSGKRLPWAPNLTANIGIAYYADNGWYGTTNLFWAGKQYFDAANTLEDNGYVLANLTIGYRFDHFDISLFCKNLFDETHAKRKGNMGKDQIIVEDSQPRTLGANLVWRF